VIKAIETPYAGHLFRSRLEARWAVFFDHLGLEWVYEKEGFDLGTEGWYLPDFWLPQVSLRGRESGVWIEVKAVDPKDDEKYQAFGKEKPLILLCGEKVHNDCYTCGCDNGHQEFSPESGWDNFMVFMQCQEPFCWHIKVEYGCYANYLHCPRCHSPASSDTASITRAIEAANSARFEHGECPLPPRHSLFRLRNAEHQSSSRAKPQEPDVPDDGSWCTSDDDSDDDWDLEDVCDEGYWGPWRAGTEDEDVLELERHDQNVNKPKAEFTLSSDPLSDDLLDLLEGEWTIRLAMNWDA
jgi:hypothetical protein